MTKHHALRLLKLATRLEAVPRADFDMDVWVQTKDGPECGTQACALGWAGLMPEFRRLGLKSDASVCQVTFVPKTLFDNKVCDAANREDQEEGFYVSPARLKEGVAAGRRFFGLSRTEACTLFRPRGTGHTTPKQVARDIRNLVGSHFPDLV
jgi:hypothetical protein